jgi:hypothetical protein
VEQFEAVVVVVVVVVVGFVVMDDFGVVEAHTETVVVVVDVRVT